MELRNFFAKRHVFTCHEFSDLLNTFLDRSEPRSTQHKDKDESDGLHAFTSSGSAVLVRIGRKHEGSSAR